MWHTWLSLLFLLSILGCYGTKDSVVYKLVENNKFPHSIAKWALIEAGKSFSIVSLSVDHHRDGMWYVPALHHIYSSGWNRTFYERGFSTRPYACSLRFFGLALEEPNLQGFVEGGTGYLELNYVHWNRKRYWHGYEKNETQRIHCYYMTNKNYGSEFLVGNYCIVMAFEACFCFLIIICVVGYPKDIGNSSLLSYLFRFRSWRILSSSCSLAWLLLSHHC